MKKGANMDEWHLYEDYWNGKWKSNFVDPKQWFDISSILFWFPTWKKILNNSQISIPIACVSRVKVYLMLLMHLVMCEECFRHGWNCVFDFLDPFISLNWFQCCLINLFMVWNYSCIFLNNNDQ